MKIRSVTPLNNGMEENSARILWDKLEGFAAYSFNKSHSVEYSLISYMTMFLKVRYPAEFYAAAMTVQDKEEKLQPLVADAIKNGLEVLPPDINISSERIEIQGDKKLYAPFQAVKGISATAAKQMREFREKCGGKFNSKEEVADTAKQRELLDIKRTFMGAAKMEALDKIGAFASLDGGLPATHPDRLRDRMALMPGFTTGVIKADRRICCEELTRLKLLQMAEERNSCDKCSLKGNKHPMVRIGKTPKFMLVFDAPNWQEGKSGQFLEGDTVEYLKAALKDAGMTLNDGYYTSLVKSPKPSGEKTLTNEQIIACTPYLKQEIELLRPPVIIAMGAAASKFFSPDSKVKTSDLIGRAVYRPDLDATIVFGINPAQVIFDPSKVSTIQKVFETLASVLE